MSGLIRGKRLAWEIEGRGWKAVTHFGAYQIALEDGDYRAYLPSSIEGDWAFSTLELAQAHCQADHDARAMASVEAALIDWVCDCAAVGDLRLKVWQVPLSGEWQWNVDYLECRTITYGIEPTRDEAIAAANQFVRRLVMGE